MASITCPECHHRFRLPTTARSGDDVTCPECEAEFELGNIPAAGTRQARKDEDDEPAYAPRDDEDRPRRRRRRRRRVTPRRGDSGAGMRQVSTGFKLVYYGLVVCVVAVAVGLVGFCLVGGALAGGGRGAAAGFRVAMLLGLLVNGAALVGAVLGLVGLFMCLAVPAETGTKPLIVVAAGFEAAAVGIALACLADMFGANLLPDAVRSLGAGSVMVFMTLAAIVFLLFTRALALHLDRPGLADDAMSILWLWLLSFLLSVGVGVALFAGGAAAVGGAGAKGIGGGMVVGGALYLVAFVLGIVALVRFARLMVDMSEATGRSAGGGSGGDGYGW